jgi:hypothetical protein
MPLDLPSIDQYLSMPIPLMPKPVEPPVPKLSAYDKLSDSQKAWIDKQIELENKPRGALGEIGAGLVRGATVGIPTMAGQIMQYTGQPGDTLHDIGTGLVSRAKLREAGIAEDVNPDAHGAVVGALTKGAEMVAPTLGAMAAVPALAALGAPAGVAAIGGGALGGLAFGTQAAQEAYERAKAAGKSEDEAKTLARQEGALTAAVQTVGVGLGGRFISGAERMIPRVLGRTYGVPEALAKIREPEFIKSFARELATNTGVQVSAGMTQAAGTAALEGQAGLPSTSPWDAATSSIGPMLALTGILAPIGAMTHYVHQQRNASLIKIAENPESTPLQIQAATRELVPQLEPLVGKDEAREWRMNALEASNHSEAEKQRIKDQQAQQEAVAAREKQVEQGQKMAVANAKAQRAAEDRVLLANPPKGAQSFSEFTTDFIKQQNLPFGKKGETKLNEGVLRASYVGYLRSLLPQEADRWRNPNDMSTMAPEASAPATSSEGQGQLTLDNSYWHGRESPFNPDNFKLEPSPRQGGSTDVGEALPFPHTNPNQGELDLMPVMNRKPGERPSPLDDQGGGKPPPGGGGGGGGTAMEAAFERAGGKKALETDAAYAQRVAAVHEPVPPKPGGVGTNPAAKHTVLLDAQARIAAANRLADDAMAGKINGNTPVAHSDLMRTWEKAATDAGIDVSVLKGQNFKRVEMAVKTADGKKLWMQQLNALRAARDAMKRGTVSRDTMDALVTKLENFNEQNANANAEGKRNAEAGGQGQEALLTKEKPNAVAEGVIPSGSVEEHQGNGGGGAPAESGGGGVIEQRPPGNAKAPAATPEVVGLLNAAPVAEVAKMPPPVASRAPVAAPKEVVVHSTGESVPWGDFTRTVPSGPVSYETPDFKPMRKQDIARSKAARIGPTVPEVEQRNVTPNYKFYFELHHYDPNESRGSSGNRTWVMDYMKAKDMAAGEPTGAHITPMLSQEKLDPKMLMANARDAIDWLRQYSPQDAQLAENTAESSGRIVTDALGRPIPDAQGKPIREGRVAQLERIYDVNASVREKAQATTEDLMNRYEQAYRMRVSAEKGIPPNKVVIDAAALAEITRLAKLDPGFEYAQSQLPNYSYSPAIAEVLKGGDLSGTLSHLADTATSDWMRYMASSLQLLDLKTKVKVLDEAATDANGDRVYGRYNHKTDTVNIYTGGENPHTIVHETTHAATVSKILLAEAALKKVVGQHTAEEKAAMASLTDLRSFMAEMKKRGSGFDKAFANEKEFVAEALSNEKFQAWLDTQSYDARSGLRKFVDWVRELLGFSPYDTNALNKAVSISKSFLGDSRFGAAEGLSYDHSATGAAAQTDSAGRALVSKWDELIANHASLGTLGGKTRAFLWQASTTFNMAKWVDKVPALRTLVPGMHAYMNADDIKGMMRQTKQLEFSNAVTMPLQLALSKLPASRRESMNRQLMEFAYDSTTLGVDFSKSYGENMHLNPKIDPSNKGYIAQRIAEYKQLPEEFRKPFEESFRVFRKNYIQHTAMMLRDTLRIYSDKSPQLQKMIDVLAIGNKALGEGTNSRPDYYFDPYSDNLDKLVRKTLTDAMAVQGDKGNLRASVRDIEKYYLTAVSNPYMHLGRSGEYFISYKVADGAQHWGAMQQAIQPFGKVINLPNADRTVMLRFENPAQRSAAYAKLLAMPNSVPQEFLRAGSLHDSDSMNHMQGVPKFVHNLLARIDSDPQFAGKDKADMRAYLKRQYLDALPDSSAQKALAQRKGTGVPGADADFVRNFSKRAEGMASMVANGYAMPKYDEAFGSMKQTIDKLREVGVGGPEHADYAEEVMTEMSRRFSNSMSPVVSPNIDVLKSFGFNYFLAFSPAFWLTNMVQPYHLTLPVIGSRYGFIATAKEMGVSSAKSFKLVKSAIESGWNQGQELGGMHGAIRGVLDLSLPLEKSGLLPQERAFVQKLLDSGQLDTTQGHELGRMASGVDSRQMVATKMLSAGSHYTEVINRLTAGLTAYNLAIRRGKTDEFASRYAIDTVRETQFNYNDNNTARALGRHGLAGKVTPLLASFQQYSFQTMELLIRLTADAVSPHASHEDRVAGFKALAGVLTTTSIIAGTLGLPLATAISALVDRVSDLASDGNNPTDSKTAYRGWLADVFGKELAEGIAHGVPRAVLGFDTGGRMGLQDLLPGSRFMADRRDIKNKMESGAFNLLGPAVSAGTSAFVGLGKMMDGQVMDGLIDMLPLALKGPVKAEKMQEQGYTTSTGNRLPIEVTPWATVSQAFGFTPSVKAEQSEVNFAFQQRIGLLKQQKTVLSNNFYRAQENGEDTTKELQAVMLFNMQNPALHIDPAAGMMLRAKQRAIAGATESDIPALPRYLPQLDRYSFANIK